MEHDYGDISSKNVPKSVTKQLYFSQNKNKTHKPVAVFFFKIGLVLQWSCFMTTGGNNTVGSNKTK